MTKPLVIIESPLAGFLDPLDISARLEELRNLKNGWMEGRGKAPNHKGLAWLTNVFESKFPDDMPLPHLYPTTEGGVQAEWSEGKNDISLEIDIDQHKGEWHALNLETKEEVTRELDLDKTEDWEWLMGQIKEVTGGMGTNGRQH